MSELIEEIPDDDYERIQAHCAKGEDYLADEQFAEAEAEFLKAFALVPEPKIFWGASMWILASLGEAYYWSGRRDEAEEALEFALRCETGEENAFVHGLYGVVLFDRGDFEGAGEHLLEAYKLAGPDSIPHDDPKYAAFLSALPAFKALKPE
jgi:tetratricopeptide (TPR) repeat protein